MLPVSHAGEADKAAARAEAEAAATSMMKAYATNDVEGYFGYFADDATLMTSGGRIQPVAEYDERWKELIGGGGGVESFDASATRTVRISDDGQSAIVMYTALPVSYRYPDSSNSGEFTITSYVWTSSIMWSKSGGKWQIDHYHYHEAGN
jgi:ketosteroid isomerase-like protein